MTFAPRTWTVGEVVSATLLNTEIRDQFASILDAWTPYTPVWTGQTTNPVLNNGTLTGRYLKVGRTCHVQIELLMGSLTTYGSGGWVLTLPFAASPSGNRIGVAHAFQSARVQGQLVVAPSASTGLLFFPATTSVSFLSLATATAPVTWAAGGRIYVSMTYETAS
ncbi:hypothetical protein ACFCXC_18410 [Streptomyces microflavus]|uniref:hypothetical protein n=1 Tax=Streptomyces microflavus TaxID=1919 RepID=UPI00192B6B09|nr:hypothetical protein [Streptomyces microflavus]QQZ54160.1 hypothetical protein IFE09_11395 [Streptomyces microflavus]